VLKAVINIIIFILGLLLIFLNWKMMKYNYCILIFTSSSDDALEFRFLM